MTDNTVITVKDLLDQLIDAKMKVDQLESELRRVRNSATLNADAARRLKELNTYRPVIGYRVTTMVRNGHNAYKEGETLWESRTILDLRKAANEVAAVASANRSKKHDPKPKVHEVLGTPIGWVPL